MKEAFQHIDNDIIFREIFRDEQTVRRNHGVPTDVDFAEGVGIFNGATSQIQYPTLNSAGISYSICSKITPANVSENETIYDIENFGYLGIKPDNGGSLVFRTPTGNAESFNITIDQPIEVVVVVTAGVATMYKDGSLQADTGVGGFGTNTLLTIGANVAGNVEFEGSIDLVEIYNRALTAAEVANL